jgi:phage baseplate assembly protein gpV
MRLTAAQRREVQSIVALMGANRRGIITSYQPAPPMVKVQIMPAPPASDGPPPETGWIPYKSWATGLGGSGWCVVAPPQAGQQVLLICEEADGENYTAWGGYYSDADPAPQGAQSGEILMQHQSGAQFYLQADGTIVLAAATVIVNGDLAVSGTISAADVTVADNISSKNHEHTSESPGTPTSAPIAGT